MSKLIIKFFIMFLILMSVAFFSLIFFQKYTMEKEIKMHSIQNTEQWGLMVNSFPYPPEKPKNPPLYIPLVLLITLSAVFVLFLLKYLDKNFIIPLSQIENNINEIKNGSLDVNFTSASENKTLQDTLTTLNLWCKV